MSLARVPDILSVTTVPEVLGRHDIAAARLGAPVMKHRVGPRLVNLGMNALGRCMYPPSVDAPDSSRKPRFRVRMISSGDISPNHSYKAICIRSME